MGAAGTRSPSSRTEGGFSLDLAAGRLRLRMAESDEDLIAARRLRYDVFYNEMGARPTPEMAARGEDFDAYDPAADHILVTDSPPGGGESIVGTYRMIRREQAARVGRFYTEDEFDIAPLTACPGEILELGRSCITAEYRSRRVLDLLWAGIVDYFFHHEVSLVFGCASFPGTDPRAIDLPLSYLHHFHLEEPEWRPRALQRRYVRMDRLGRDAVDARAGFKALPALLRGYLRLGGTVGDGAVVDRQFGTVDVCMVLRRTAALEARFRQYRKRFGPVRPG